MHDDIVALSTRGQRRIVDAGHNIPIEQPRAVTAAIEDVIDIDTDPVLEARYNEAVPVLVCDGTELCRYHLDEARVRAALAARIDAPAR